MTVPVDFEHVLQQHIGPMGKWQTVAFLVINISTVSLLSFYSQLTALAPPHRCSIPLLDRSTDPINDSAVLRVAIPPASPNGRNYRGHSSCTQYNMSLLLGNFSAANASAQEVYEEVVLSRQDGARLQIVPCQHGWRYDENRAVFRNSFSQRFNLVCQYEFLIVLTTAVYGIGALMGCLVGGFLADLFGRKFMALGIALSCSFTGALLGTSTSVGIFTMWRLLSGFLTNGAEVIGLALWSELTDAKHRNFLFTLFGVELMCIAPVASCVFAYFVQDWRFVHIFMSAHLSLSVLFLCLVPESPRWLLARGDFERAFRIIRRAIAWNRGPGAMSEEELAEMESGLRKCYSAKIEDEKNKTQMRPGVVDHALALFTIPILRRYTICFTTMFFVKGTVMCGLLFYVVRLHGVSSYIAATIGFLLSLPGVVLKSGLYHYFDRRRPLAGMFFGCAIFCGTQIILLIVKVDGFVHIVLSWFAICFLFAAYFMQLNYATECYPTLHRNYAMGLVTAFDYFGFFFGVFLQRFDKLWQPLPMIGFTALAGLASLMTVLTPASSNQEMRDVVADVEMEVKEKEAEVCQTMTPAPVNSNEKTHLLP